MRDQHDGHTSKLSEHDESLAELRGDFKVFGQLREDLKEIRDELRDLRKDVQTAVISKGS